ncbi:MAG: amino acid adenylation domain-containing protein, partial [Desulfovibrionaceae bacterium]
ATFALDADRTRALAALAARSGVTAGALLQAAWAVLLARLCDADDVVFGLVTSGREADLGPTADVERLVAVCIRTVPVRVRLDDAPAGAAETLPALARRIQADAARRLSHETLPLADIQTLADPGAGLFDHLLLFETYPTAMEDHGLRLDGVRGTEQLPYGLGLAVLPGAELGFRFSYDRRRFPEAFMADLRGRWLAVLDAVLAHPDAPARACADLPEAQARRLTARAAAARRPWDDARPLPLLFAERARRDPERIALTWEGPDGPVDISYGRLAARVAQLAEALRALLAGDAGPGAPVAVCLERGPDLPAALLAAQAVGAPYVPLDPVYPADRLAAILESSGAAVLVAQAATADAPGAEAAGRVRLLRVDERPWPPEGEARTLDMEGDARTLDLKTLDLKAAPGPDDLAYVIYTSGSTGAPKGVEVTHRGLTNFLRSMAETPGLGPDDVLVAVTTVCFDIAGLELFLPLIRGARVVLAGREDAADAGRLAALLDRHRATVLQATPTTWAMLTERGWGGRPELKALVGGEALPAPLAAALTERCAEVWNLYGPTETTIWSTLARVERAGAAGSAPAVGIGKPIANTSAWVLGRNLELLPDGAVGELCLGGDGLARGYRGRPDLTAERFVTLPFPPFERVYRTGDLAAWNPAGGLDYLGRSDFQVKVRGFRIEPGEVEDRLTAAPGVSRAVVMAGDWRGAGPELAAWLAGPDGATAMPDDAALRALLLRELPYYMVPACFVRLDELPLTPNGKIDRKRLPAPEAPARPAPGAPGPAPADDLEARLCACFAQALDLPRADPGTHFFAHGGDSLRALRLCAAVEAACGRRCPAGELFRAPTPAELAQRLRTAGTADTAQPFGPGPEPEPGYGQAEAAQDLTHDPAHDPTYDPAHDLATDLTEDEMALLRRLAED